MIFNLPVLIRQLCRKLVRDESFLKRSERLLKKWLVLLFFMSLLVTKQHEVTAASYGYAVIDADSGRLLFGTNEHAQLPIASLTKMWTAYVVIHNSDLQEQVQISREAASQEGSSIYLEAGETVSVETLLYGLMLRSGNDAAYALAEHVGGSIEGFVKLMNDEALFHGLLHTTFTNPSGLHHERHLSTAYDTAKMLQIAMKNDTFRKIATAKTYKSEAINGTVWLNKHKLLHSNEAALAGKTGYTKVAGRTLATYFENDNKGCVVVTLNESNDWQVHEAAANRVWREYTKVNVVKQGKYQVLDEVVVQLAKPIELLIASNEQNQLRHVLHISRHPKANTKAIWNVFIGSERVYSTAVKLNE